MSQNVSALHTINLLTALSNIDDLRQRLEAARESALCNFVYERDGCSPYAELPVDDIEEALAVLHAVAL